MLLLGNPARFATWPWKPCNATSLAENPTCGRVGTTPHVGFFATLVALQGFHGHVANRAGFPSGTIRRNVTRNVTVEGCAYIARQLRQRESDR
jgi:hypothetical protein